jgi:hypothetical protein
MNDKEFDQMASTALPLIAAILLPLSLIFKTYVTGIIFIIMTLTVIEHKINRILKAFEIAEKWEKELHKKAKVEAKEPTQSIGS